MPVFGKIAIVGVGLIGGSAGMALLKKGAADEITGIARRKETIAAALSKGAISRGTLNLEEGLKGSDFVLVAAPVSAAAGIIKECLPLLGPETVITDAGSIKRDIVYDIEKFNAGRGNFIGSHPVAGSEKSGIESAEGNLFEGADCIITPLPGRAESREKAEVFWKMLGMRVSIMSPEAHDSLMAMASHLPHIASCAMVNSIAGLFAAETADNFISAGGFRDTTRIAAAPAELWKDILLSNRDNLAADIKEYVFALNSLLRALENNDADYVLNFLKRAGANRNNLIGGGKT